MEYAEPTGIIATLFAFYSFLIILEAAIFGNSINGNRINGLITNIILKPIKLLLNIFFIIFSQLFSSVYQYPS